MESTADVFAGHLEHFRKCSRVASALGDALILQSPIHEERTVTGERRLDRSTARGAGILHAVLAGGVAGAACTNLLPTRVVHPNAAVLKAGAGICPTRVGGIVAPCAVVVVDQSEL